MDINVVARPRGLSCLALFAVGFAVSVPSFAAQEGTSVVARVAAQEGTSVVARPAAQEGTSVVGWKMLSKILSRHTSFPFPSSGISG